MLGKRISLRKIVRYGELERVVQKVKSALIGEKSDVRGLTVRKSGGLDDTSLLETLSAPAVVAIVNRRVGPYSGGQSRRRAPDRSDARSR